MTTRKHKAAAVNEWACHLHCIIHLTISQHVKKSNGGAKGSKPNAVTSVFSCTRILFLVGAEPKTSNQGTPYMEFYRKLVSIVVDSCAYVTNCAS